MPPIYGFNNVPTGLAGYGFRRTEVQGGPPGVGGNDADTILLMNCDGADGDQTFIDSSAVARTLTPASANPINSTEQSKFGLSSVKYRDTGVYGLARINTPFTADLAWTIAEPFTIDMWLYFFGFAGEQYLLFKGGNGWRFGRAASGGVGFRGNAGGGVLDIAGATPIPTSQWVHVAVSKAASGTGWVYIDGVVDGTAAQASDINNTEALSIGAPAAPPLLLYMDEIRISKIDRYGGVNFTPPAGPYS